MADVTWTGPFQRGQAQLSAAGEHLEFGRRTDARDCLTRHLHEVRALLDCIEEEEMRDVQLRSAQAQHVAIQVQHQP